MFHGYLAGRPYLRNTCENQLSWLFAFLSCVEHMALLRGKSSCELPAKTLLIFNFVLSFHILSHTQPIQWNPTWNTEYIRLNKITIKFGTELKPIQNSCKSQLYKPIYDPQHKRGSNKIKKKKEKKNSNKKNIVLLI